MQLTNGNAVDRMRFDCVIFDLDGTLLDTSPDILDCLAKAYEKTTGSVPPGLTVSAVGPSLSEMIRFLTPELSEEQLETVTSNFRASYDSSSYPKTKPYPGMLRLLKELSGRATLLVATNKRRTPTLRILDLMGMTCFKDIMTFDTEPGKKLEKSQSILILLERWKLEGAKTAYVGDTAADILAAKKAGVSAIAITWGYGNKAELAKNKPDYLVRNVAELKKALG